ncbi:MAG: hypothetical protein ACI8SE_000149 [Bacteroidia bacterium]|jgi:hypothetical protein
MFIKQVIGSTMLLLTLLPVYSQVITPHDISSNIGKARLHIETSALRYKQKSTLNNSGFGFGVGGEMYFWGQRKGTRFSFAPTVLFQQTNEELKTYSVENASYYYRSTTLTGRFLLACPLSYKFDIGKQLQLGLGFQPQFLLASRKDNYTAGTSISAIPDIEFRKTDVSFLGTLTYLIGPKYAVNFIAQIGASPITLGEEQPYANAFRMQLSRRIL